MSPAPTHSPTFRLLALALAATALAGLSLFASGQVEPVQAQQPTGSVATVTGTAEGAMVTVYADRNLIEVYAGPSSYLYPPVGVLTAGERVPALGFSVDRQWIQIVYLGVSEGVGWIYAPYVSLSPGFSLPELKAPPTSTPRTTPTLDPTMVAQYGLNVTPEKLPTFTQPPPLEVPEFEPGGTERSPVPLGLVILLVALLGILGSFIAFTRGRR